jgi:hypothetical protein
VPAYRLDMGYGPIRLKQIYQKVRMESRDVSLILALQELGLKSYMERKRRGMARHALDYKVQTKSMARTHFHVSSFPSFRIILQHTYGDSSPGGK